MALTTTVDNHDDVDPDIRSFVDTINRSYEEQMVDGDVSLARRREIAELVRTPWRSGGPEMVETLEFKLDGLIVRLHRPIDEKPLPATLYIHGGGWMIFSIDTHDRLMREYAARAGCVVVGIEYSLSPEAKFPVALNEIITVLSWMRENADALGIDSQKLAIGGDSAGANLSVAACLKLRALGQEQPQAMILNYGAFDPEPAPSYQRFGGPSYALNVAEMDDFWAGYVTSAEDLGNPLVAVALADPSGLPPSFFAIAQCDILADCNHALAQKMRGADVQVKAVEYAGATHSFLEAVSIAPLAVQALEDQAAWLKKIWSS